MDPRIRLFDTVKVTMINQQKLVPPHGYKLPEIGDICAVIDLFYDPIQYELEFVDNNGKTVWQGCFTEEQLGISLFLEKDLTRPIPKFSYGDVVRTIGSHTHYSGDIIQIIWHHNLNKYTFFLRGKSKRYFEEDLVLASE